MSLYSPKFVPTNFIKGTTFRLDNGETLRARNNANSADVDILKLTGSDVIEFQSVPTVVSSASIPTSSKQLATVEYITNYVNGKVDAKDSVHALADSNQALTGSTPLIIDGWTFANATNLQRVALTGQSTGSQNGIYTYSDAAGTYTLTRAADFDQIADASGLEVRSGAYFQVIHGTTYAGYEALLSTADPIVVDTTALTFAKYPASTVYLAGDMLAISGNTFAVALATLSGLKSSNPGNPGGLLSVSTDGASLEKDKTTRIDPSAGTVMAKKSKKLRYTLGSTDITNQYLDLADVAADSSIQFIPDGAPSQVEGVDYTVSYTGGVSSKTRITFAGGLATGGVSALVATDTGVIEYMSF